MQDGGEYVILEKERIPTLKSLKHNPPGWMDFDQGVNEILQLIHT